MSALSHRLLSLIFIVLVLTYGRQYLGLQAGLAIVVDLSMVILFILYLIGAPSSQHCLIRENDGLPAIQ